MATLAATTLTLADHTKRMDPDGRIAQIAELLNQSNEVLLDMPLKEGNLPVGHIVTVRTGLPTPTWRKLNGPVAPTKSTTAQIQEQCGMLEDYSEVDVDVADLNGNRAAFRLSEALPHIEGINESLVETLIYGDTADYPERFTGLEARFNSLSAKNGQQIVDGGGTSSDNTSIWLVGWGEESIFGIYPKGSQVGLKHEDLGQQTKESASGLMQVLRDHWQWKIGIALKDWGFVSRIANIDVSNLIAESSAADLIKLMSKAISRIKRFTGITGVFYANRTVCEMLRIQALNKSASALAVEPALNQFGMPTAGILRFNGFPIRTIDRLLLTESRIT